MVQITQRSKWLIVAVTVVAVSLFVLFSPLTRGDQANARAIRSSDASTALTSATQYRLLPENYKIAETSQNDFGGWREQVFRDNLTVRSGQTIREDVVVYGGNVAVQQDGAIDGNLAVYSGNIEVQQGGAINGDVSTLSGNIIVAGTVRGNLASWSGNISLRRGASVGGDVSVLSGKVDRQDGAAVGGQIVRGPRFNMAPKPGQVFPFPSNPLLLDSARFGNGAATVWAGMLRFVLRLIAAGMITLLVALIASVPAYVKPDYILSVSTTIRERRALSFAVGIVCNLALAFLAGLLALTICLIPIALIPILVVGVLNIIGWSALSLHVGRWAGKYIKLPANLVFSVAIGALLMTGVLSAFWVFGGCLRFVGFVIWLIIASLGLGATIMPWFERYTKGHRPESSRVTPVAQEQVANSPDAEGQATPAESVTKPVDFRESSGGPELTDTEPMTQISPQDAPEFLPPATPVSEADFTRIKGIGPVFDQRLKAANVRTFLDLAALSPEQIAEIIGWPPERVIRTDLIAQARALVNE